MSVHQQFMVNSQISGEINKFLQKEQQECATKIQAWYRGHLVRTTLKEKFGIKMKTSAAIKLQRGVRI